MDITGEKITLHKKERTSFSHTPEKVGFCRSLKEFAQSTTFHGLRQVSESRNLSFLRYLWVLLLLTCSSLLVWQIIDRVVHYYSSPTTVNIKVNYNTTLRFPSVTLCNQNAFKSSLASQHNLYRLLERMHSSPSMTSSDLHDYGAENMTLDQIYLSNAHKKDDFITRCIWKNHECTPEDFDVALTDHGVCFTFKLNEQDEFISSPGVENGLRLSLNVEQYEYMPGPHGSAGVKMLLHDDGDEPRVHELGQAMATGSHVFIGVKLFQLSNLPSPHGMCQEKNLEYSDIYTLDNCLLDCITRQARETCGCRHIYMYHKNNYPPICTLSEYYDCLKPLINIFSSHATEQCDCPVPCKMRIYEPVISYASISQYAVNKFLSADNATSLASDLLKAREVTSRMDRDTYNKTCSLATKFQNSLFDIEKLLLEDLTMVADMLDNDTQKRYQHTQELYSFKEFLYRYQIYIVKQNFIRPRDAMEERTIHIVALAYAEFILSVESKIRKLAESSFTDASAREVIFESTVLMLENRQEIIHRAIDNYTSLINAYDTGMQIFNYKFEDIPRSHNIPAAPKFLIRESRVHNSYARKYGERYGQYLNRTIESLDWLKELAQDAYEFQTLNESRMVFCREEFRYLMRNFVFARSVFYTNTIEWPIGILQGRLDNLNSLWTEYNTIAKNIAQSMKSLKSDIRSVISNFLFPLQNASVDIMEYLEKDTKTKLSAAETLTSNTISEQVIVFKQFFQQLQVRETNIRDWLERKQKAESEIWQVVLEDEDSEEYYEYTSRTMLTRNFSEISEEIFQNYTKLLSFCRFSELIENKDTAFLSSLEEFAKDAKNYINSLVIDSTFVSQNFLQLDIFYRQMSYEEILQQEAYNGFALICDIGGSMGLFLGASILSMFEIIDVIIDRLFHYMQFRIFSNRKRHVKKTQAF